ncbi:LANO_0E04324g1_1 [Lachancea nothofagi CBS 11611]|uniref:LANO_0E04324g1_1 n=1 Tax=Lachancea nothofagi CBS 11611 TaxID=1266666 RepID=A0A1G4JRZ3_9SACH|nr:LANO_0E04324g1_1 [Lachancea nothofagi CBS 11611]
MRDPRHQKFVWTARHDCALVDSVLALGDVLADPIRSYPRTKFWAAVSDELHVAHGLVRNSRQCRDRFNLLFSRALLVPTKASRPASLPTETAGPGANQVTPHEHLLHSRSHSHSHSHSQSLPHLHSQMDPAAASEPVLEARLQACALRFRFGNGRSLELNINSPPRANIVIVPPLLPSPPPPPRTGALHEVIHPPEPLEETSVAHPEPRFADLALIHSQLRHVNSVLDTLTADVSSLKTQVNDLQQYLHSQGTHGDAKRE